MFLSDHDLIKQVKLGVYKHFKRGVYEVVCVAKHSETMEELVVYKSVKDGKVWVRPKKMFLEKVMIEGKRVPRFKLVKLKKT